jgi:transcriptional regulator with XRE-family HTH domain
MRPVPDVTSNATSLGAIIRLRRIEAGLRIEDLAYKTRLAAKTIVRVESGMDAKISTIHRIAAAFDTAASELLRQAEEAVSEGEAA